MEKKTNRPTSPHLQIYKLPPTGIASISHRITGVFLAIGLIFFACLISSVANGTESYANMQAVLAAKLPRLIYWGFVYALFFHLCHGVRHLIWDMGRGFEREAMNRHVLIELAASVLLTLMAFIYFH